ncbi:MAG: hypothetical protein DU429_09240 [Candidatus Tokpelaia sp.]|nr:MAG: hypothetical protein DU430_09240 [Candidatus Tokpelaia sp.]KAA6204337.1 MAG: hypothetical protein DU429_09240 [Candidatus Tokpelaia sp.]
MGRRDYAFVKLCPFCSQQKLSAQAVAISEIVYLAGMAGSDTVSGWNDFCLIPNCAEEIVLLCALPGRRKKTYRANFACWS